MYGSYGDRLASAARRRGELVGAGALGAIPAVELATPAPAGGSPVGESGAHASDGRGGLARRERSADASRTGSRATEGGAKDARAVATGAGVKPDGPAGGAIGASPAPAHGAGNDGVEGTVGGPRWGGSAAALAKLANVGSGARAIVVSNATTGASSSAPRAGGSPGVGIGAQRVRSSAVSAGQRAQPARPAQRDALIEQIQRGLAKALQSKDGEVTVRLRPENLGLVKVRVRVESSRVTAALEATSEQARELLSQNLATLERALEARGLSVDRVVVEHVPAHVTDDGSRHSREHWGGASPRATHGRSPSGPDAERPEEEPVSAASEWSVDAIHIDAVA